MILIKFIKPGTKVMHSSYGQGTVVKDTEQLCHKYESFVKFRIHLGKPDLDSRDPDRTGFRSFVTSDIVLNKDLQLV